MRALALVFLLLASTNAAAAVSPAPRLGSGEASPVGSFIAIGPSWDEARDIVESLGGRVTTEFRYLGGVAFEGSPKIVETLSSLGYMVAPEMTFRLVRPNTNDAEPIVNFGAHVIGAPDAWSMGLTGRGVRVAILDTGIQNDHPWLMRGDQSVVKWEIDATESGVVDYCGKGRRSEASAHGTHMAGIVASQSATFRGVAPDADLYDIIVFSPYSDCRSTSEVTVIKALEHALMGPDGRPNSGDEADVIALSFIQVVEPEQAFRITRGIAVPIILTLFERAAKEKVIVVPAGNTASLNSFNLLCLAKGVICVGASHPQHSVNVQDYAVAYFSSKGPGLPGLIVPHVLAPGNGILSTFPTEIRMVGHLSSTTASASFVAGAAAILIQNFWRQRLTATPLEIMSLLVHTAKGPIPSGLARTVADVGAGQIDLRSALWREILIHHNEFPFAHVYGNSGTIEVRLTSLSNWPQSYSVRLRFIEIYDFWSISDLFRTQGSISLGPRETAVIHINFSHLPPGTFGGYLILESSSGTYRFPFIVSSPIVISAEGLRVLSNIFTRMATRSPTDILTFFIEAKEPVHEPLSISIISTWLIYNAVFSITLPSGGVSSIYTSSGYILNEAGTYLITVRGSSDLTHVPLHLRIGAPLLTRSVGSSLQVLSVVKDKIDLLESAVRSLNASIGRLDAALSREREERRGEIAKIDQALIFMQAAARSLEESLRVIRSELVNIGESLSRTDTTLAEAIRAEVERVGRLEAEARALQQTLSSLSQELSAVEGEVTEREKEIRELRGDHGTTRIIAIFSTLVALVALALSGYLLWTRR
ncbi:MAG: S8 family serine peptidase [Acidilobaceae archaeon]